MRITAPLNSDGFPVQGFGPARSSSIEPSSSPDSDFHSMMENNSLEAARAEESARRPQSQPGSDAPAKPANIPHRHAASSRAKDADGSKQSEKQASTNATTDTPASTAEELKKLAPNGRFFGDLSLEEQDQSDGTETSAQASENDGASSTSGGAASNAAKSAVALLAQRANAGLLTSTILGLENKPRTGASFGKDDSQESGDSLNQSLSALDPSAGPQAGGSPRQATTLDARGSLQLNSLEDGIADAGDPRIQESTSGTANPNSQVAFEAKLSPAANAANTSASAAQQNSQEQGQASDQGLGKQSSQTLPEDAAPASAAIKAEAALAPPVTAQAVQAAPTVAHHPHTSATAQPADSPAATRMESIIEAPAPLASSRHSILVKVPGATADTGIDLRFVERAGDIHLSVRTPNSEVAQQLRGGLNDLVGKLEHAGIRTEVSSPSTGDAQLSNQSRDQNNKQDSSPDRRGGRSQQDSQSQQQPSREQNQSRWFQALADSATPIETSTFSKEQNV